MCHFDLLPERVIQEAVWNQFCTIENLATSHFKMSTEGESTQPLSLQPRDGLIDNCKYEYSQSVNFIANNTNSFDIIKRQQLRYSQNQNSYPECLRPYMLYGIVLINHLSVLSRRLKEVSQSDLISQHDDDDDVTVGSCLVEGSFILRV